MICIEEKKTQNSHTNLVNFNDTVQILSRLFHTSMRFFFFELKAAAVNVYQNETVNLILRKHAIKREHTISHAYSTESEPHFNSVLIHLIVFDGTTHTRFTRKSLKVAKSYVK